MPRSLTSETSVDHLRKEAKIWLKALRAGADQPDARTRLAAVWPGAPDSPGLRDIQYALAREYGFPGWMELKRAAADRHSQQGEPDSPREQAIQALLNAAASGDATSVESIESILTSHPDMIDERGTLTGHTGLRTALHFGVGTEAVVRALLARGANPNIRDEGDNAFPLHFAAENGNLEIVRLLVEHGAQTVAGEVDDHQMDIIGWATCFAEVHRDVVDYLLAHGARHTLHSAVAVGDVEAIRARAAEQPEAIERPMDKSNRRRRALHLAVIKRQPGALRALLDLGADPNGLDAGGLSPLDEAALAGEHEMAHMLIGANATLTLASAVALDRGDDVARLLREGERQEALKPGGKWETLIVKAAIRASGRIIEKLIQLGANVDVLEPPETSVDETMAFTALHAAAFNGNLEAVEVLLRNGANTRIRDSRYTATPAGWAEYAGRSAVFARLLDADLDIFDAIRFDRPERIDEILRRDPGALIRPFRAYLPAGAEHSPSHDLTPLECATVLGKTRAGQVLAARGAELSGGGHLARTPAQRAASFVRMACIDGTVGGTLRTQQTHAADRLLREHPELSGYDFCTAVICGDVEEVRRRLDEDPSLANAAGGPRGWTPLLYLCTARLPSRLEVAENAVAIAGLLLDRGADPNVYYPGGNETIHYTVLASVIGRGEEQAPLHPRARELAALLLDRGAEPYDVQLFYNGFGWHASHPLLADDDLVWLLELIYQASLRRGRASDWRDPDWMMIGVGGYGGGAWYLLSSALRGNYLSIARWALERGASPNPPRASDSRTSEGTLYEQALSRGLDEFAELLATYGAVRHEWSHASGAPSSGASPSSSSSDTPPSSPPSPSPETSPSSPPSSGAQDDRQRLLRAAEHGLVDTVKALLDRGVSPDSEDDTHTRPLHWAAYAGRLPVVQLLVARGAEIDPRDDTHHSTPIYWAWYGQRRHVVDVLAPLSRDVWTLVPAGHVARIRDVLSAEPRLARVYWEGGTPLFYLPDDEEAAAEIVRLFLAAGADAGFTRKDGTTAATIAKARGLTAAGELLSHPPRGFRGIEVDEPHR